MSEQTETRELEKPAWLELSEPEKERHTYWTCYGKLSEPPAPSLLQRIFSRSSREVVEVWTAVFHSKEEAEANSSTQDGLWRWDGNPAKPVRLSDEMLKVRRQGRAGIECVGFVDGEWVVLKQWPAGRPLMGEDQ